mmetsp:Transcript_19953/g.64787  ORF Transcript_19953/g.64787 Transcript_19953/m.64787 type:complete len:97 (+) Transcript_19953:303-593(+)
MPETRGSWWNGGNGLLQAGVQLFTAGHHLTFSVGQSEHARERHASAGMQGVRTSYGMCVRARMRAWCHSAMRLLYFFGGRSSMLCKGRAKEKKGFL